MTSHTDTRTAFETLKLIFSDQPDLLEILKLSDLESEGWIERFQKTSGVFAQPINMYVAGRTGAGKTSLGNILFGQQVMRSTGFMDCTDYVGLLRLKSNLWYFDTPGGGSKEKYENITRAALALEQLTDDPVQTFEIRDFTDATSKDQGVVIREITPADWAGEYMQTFAPDVILFTAAPHMQFIRGDREYLEALWKAYPNKIVFALNIWHTRGVEVTKSENIEDAKEQIERVRQKLFPGGKTPPPFAVINALTGAGINEITEQICRVVPQDKLGNMQSILSDELKVFAEKERNLRFRRALHRMAARLALYTVNQKIRDQNIMNVAASAIVYYAVVTFKNAEKVAVIQQELYATLQARIMEIQQEQSEQIMQKIYETEQRPITVKTPKIKNVKRSEDRTTYVPREVTTKERKGLLDRAVISTEGFFEKAGSLLKNRSTRDFKAIDQITAARKYRESVHTEFDKKVDTVTRFEQVFDGYQTEIVDYVNAVVSVKEELVGEKPLEGGQPLIEFLVGLGLGIQDFCLDQSNPTSALPYITDKIQFVQLKLVPFKSTLEQLIRRGVEAETQIIELLTTNLSDS